MENEIGIAEELVAASQIVKSATVDYEIGPEDEFFRVVQLFYMNFIVEALESLICLFKSGYGRQIPIIARSAFEAAIKSKHLFFHKSSTYLLLYRIQFARSHSDSVNRLRAPMGGSLIDAGDEKIRLSEINALESTKALIDQLGTLDPALAVRVKEDSYSLWPGKNLKAFISEISPDLRWSYPTIYENCAEFCHANLGVVTEYVVLKKPISTFNRPVNLDFYLGFLLSICSLVIDLWENLEQAGIMTKPIEIEIIKKKFDMIT